MAGRAMAPDRMRREVETMSSLVSGAGKGDGIEAAQDATADLDRNDSVAQRHAQATVAALQAAHRALAAAKATIQ